ncbi:hypothetical protein SDC9_125126 [bioreactor metagenome]|uniref:Uncharacterized protein n=1 Tax=bioreactor metagenome TaxID=1076179 RepID=A0A645CMI4_9ZZZZ
MKSNARMKNRGKILLNSKERLANINKGTAQKELSHAAKGLCFGYLLSEFKGLLQLNCIGIPGVAEGFANDFETAFG